MMLLYNLFTAFVLVSFLWFGRTWLADYKRWHIGWMSFSYTGFVLIYWVLLHLFCGACPKLREQLVQGPLIYLLAVFCAGGILGLSRYWIYDVRYIYKWWRSRHG
jgi:hypothetical protein